MSDSHGGFGPTHLPYAVFSVDGGRRRVGVRLGDAVVDLAEATGRPETQATTLDPLLALGPGGWRQLREQVLDLAPSAPTVPLERVELHLPFQTADYVDFYASEHHASRVGRILRPGEEPLPAAWRHLPIGYHGRAGTIVPSGTGIVRPTGQLGLREDGTAEHGPTRKLDLEAELGFVVGAPSPPGAPVPAAALAEHVFGVVGLNDWSARDVQAFESRPLGPFLGKSFATSVGHWVTPLAALDEAWCPLPAQDPEPLPYLEPGRTRGLAIDVEVEVDGEVLSRPSYADMYWSPGQLLAHLTSGGARLRTGDLFASGTISGPEECGCLLELWEDRRYLEDGAEVVLRYAADAVGGGRLSLGEVRGRVLPAR